MCTLIKLKQKAATTLFFAIAKSRSLGFGRRYGARSLSSLSRMARGCSKAGSPTNGGESCVCLDHRGLEPGKATNSQLRQMIVRLCDSIE